jgi:membrane protease YdiL (CAAX protease family)
LDVHRHRAGAASLLLLFLNGACATELQHARRELDEPIMEREKEAFARVTERDCQTIWIHLLPGVGQLCLGETAEGAALVTTSLAELSLGISVAAIKDVQHPGAAVPLIAATDLLIYSDVDEIFQEQLARRLTLVPQDSLGDLLAAPFNIEALSAPDVWLGIIGTLAVGLAVSELTDRSTFRDTQLGADPNLFGTTMKKAIGYPLAAGIGVAAFTQVAMAEESFFRGFLQSGFARKYGDDWGWFWASLVFGAAHAPNALFLESDKRASYLEFAVPTITALGAYLGLSYRWHDYGLAAPVAIHFWYDFLLSAVTFFLHPQNSPISARIALPF